EVLFKSFTVSNNREGFETFHLLNIFYQKNIQIFKGYSTQKIQCAQVVKMPTRIKIGAVYLRLI
ncbi:MAG: hypothetical protein Q4D42_10400, partial [Eubacteriales bacterium]|nr:hypothetical protein [Eubacteriales bacterium]